MLYPSTAGIVFLKRLERPDIGKTIEERSIRLLAEEERIKSDRAAHIKWLMSKGHSQEEATKRAYKKFGEGYFERQERMTAEQNQRLYLEQNPPEPGGLFGGNGVLGIVAAVGIAIVLAALAWYAIPAIAGSLLPMLTSLGVAAKFTATAIATSVVGAVSGFVSNTTSQLMNGVKFDVVDALKAAGIAAAMAVAAYGVGHAPGLKELWETGKVFNSVSVPNLTLKPLLHGAAQGGISMAAGGEFAQGFLSGAFSSVSGSLINSIGGSDQITRLDMLGRAFAGAAAGAGGAALVNGDVALGAIQGGFVQLFNDCIEYENGRAKWVVEKDGYWSNEEVREVDLGVKDGDRIYLKDKYGGGWIPASQAEQYVKWLWTQYGDISGLSIEAQDLFIKECFDRMKAGEFITMDKVVVYYSKELGKHTLATLDGIPKGLAEFNDLLGMGYTNAANTSIATPFQSLGLYSGPRYESSQTAGAFLPLPIGTLKIAQGSTKFENFVKTVAEFVKFNVGTGEAGKATNFWASPNEGRLLINGIEYTTHALERMAPKGLLQKGTEVISRGIPPSVVENAIKYGKVSPGNTAAEVVRTYDNIRVVTNPEGTKVITVMKIRN